MNTYPYYRLQKISCQANRSKNCDPIQFCKKIELGIRKHPYKGVIMISVRSAVDKRMRDILNDKKMSAYRLQKDSGIPVGTIKGLMRETNPSVNLKTVLQIIRALGITTQEFFSDPIFDSDELDVD